jgi:hypothetical protein
MRTATLCFALLLSFNVAAQPPAEKKDATYFPMQVGATWQYKAAESKMTVKIVGHEKIGDVMCTKMETSIDGSVVANEHIAHTADGFARVAYNGQKLDKPLLFLKLPSKSGESWDIDTKIGGQSVETIKGKLTVGEEEIEVPAGKYKTVTASGEMDINGQPAKFSFWFAENVGIVKLTIEIGVNVQVRELLKYEPAK